MASRARTFLRIVIILLALLGAGVLILVLSPWPSQLVRKHILDYATELSGGIVTIGSLEAQLFPPRLILRDVRIEAVEPQGVEWRFACKEADLLLPYGAYGGHLRRIESVDLLEPTLDYRRQAPV